MTIDTKPVAAAKKRGYRPPPVNKRKKDWQLAAYWADRMRCGNVVPIEYLEAARLLGEWAFANAHEAVKREGYTDVRARRYFAGVLENLLAEQRKAKRAPK